MAEMGTYRSRQANRLSVLSRADHKVFVECDHPPPGCSLNDGIGATCDGSYAKAERLVLDRLPDLRGLDSIDGNAPIADLRGIGSAFDPEVTISLSFACRGNHSDSRLA